AFLAREESADDGGEPLDLARELVRPADEEHEDNRRARGEQRFEEFLLPARQAQVGSVASLAGRAAAEQAGHVAEHGYAHVGLSRRTRRRGDALVVTAQYRAALGVADVVTGGVRAQGVEHGRH